MKGTTGQVLRVLRRSAALSLAATALWMTARAASLSIPGQALHTLSQDTGFSLSLLRAQLPNHETKFRWQQLVLAQSPLLSCARRQSGDPPPSEQPQQPPTLPDARDEDLSEPTLPDQPPEHTNIIPKTMVPSPTQDYLRTGDIYIANRAQKQADVTALASAPIHISLSDGPQILILHSHGSEAYTPAGTDQYEESDPYRTTNCNYNMVRVGEEIAQVLRTQGFQVVHDTTLYDYPSYNEAYDRSLVAAQRWLTQYPSIQVVLDVHRDALTGEDETIYKTLSPQGREQAAQVMLVVGTDGSKKHPLWKENLTFAMRIQQQLLDDHDTLARPMVLRSSRYNQHLSVGSILVEVGSHGNTLQEALLGARLFGESAATVLQALKS